MLPTRLRQDLDSQLYQIAGLPKMPGLRGVWRYMLVLLAILLPICFLLCRPEVARESCCSAQKENQENDIHTNQTSRFVRWNDPFKTPENVCLAVS